jgi:serine/threonine-protein kinase
MIDPWIERAIIAGRYTLEARLGERTWRARDSREDRLVVLRWEQDEALLLDRYARLERAHMLAGTVVAAPYDRGREGDRFWMSREHVDGSTLDRALRERWSGTSSGPTLGSAWFAETLRPIAQSLARLHRAGIAHGALWPEHVVLTSSGARFLSVEREKLRALPQSTKVEGALRYFSPGLWRGLDKRFADDLWALGVIAFEMLVGRSYWQSSAALKLASEVLTSAIEAPSVRAQGFGVSAPVSRGFDDWFLACVSRDEARGYADGDEALDALEVLVLRSLSDPAAPRPPGPCLNVVPIACLIPVGPPPEACLMIAPKAAPALIERLRDAWDERRAQREHERAREREEQECARQQNEHRDNPYRGVIVRVGEGGSSRRRRAAFVGVAVSAAVIAWWLAKRC